MNDISASHSHIEPGVQLSGRMGRMEKKGVNSNLSHRSAFKEHCWKGQLFEKHFTPASAAWLKFTEIQRPLLMFSLWPGLCELWYNLHPRASAKYVHI